MMLLIGPDCSSFPAFAVEAIAVQEALRGRGSALGLKGKGKRRRERLNSIELYLKHFLAKRSRALKPRFLFPVRGWAV